MMTTYAAGTNPVTGQKWMVCQASDLWNALYAKEEDLNELQGEIWSNVQEALDADPSATMFAPGLRQGALITGGLSLHTAQAGTVKFETWMDAGMAPLAVAEHASIMICWQWNNVLNPIPSI